MAPAERVQAQIHIPGALSTQTSDIYFAIVLRKELCREVLHSPGSMFIVCTTKASDFSAQTFLES